MNIGEIQMNNYSIIGLLCAKLLKGNAYLRYTRGKAFF